MAPPMSADDGAQLSVEDLLKAFIAALQSLQAHPQDSHFNPPADASGQSEDRTEPPPSPSQSASLHAEKYSGGPIPQEKSLLRDEEPWMKRLWRADGNGGWITHSNYLQSQRPEVLKGTKSEAIDEPAIYLEMYGRGKAIEIRSRHLIEAINKVNKHPSLQKRPETSIELYEPFPLLYDHLEDVGKEISRLDLREADADFKALECAAREVTSRWNTARAENLDSGFVQFDTLWRLFHAGDIVVHKDDLNNEWLLTLIDVDEKLKQRSSGQAGPETIERYISLRTWGLVWNGDENKLERKVAVFHIPHFLGGREIHLLPLYPVRYRQGHESTAEFLKRIAARGRAWFQMIATKTSCREYDGPAFDEQSLRSSRGPRAEVAPEKIKLENTRVVVSDKSKQLATSKLEGLLEFQNGRGMNPAELDTREQYQWDSLAATAVLTDEQARLCVPLIGCYAIKSKGFYLVDFEKLKLVAWNPDALRQLVLDPGKKDLLEGLVSQHYDREQGRYRRDFVANKGEGLVVLLHGPPGVGKTLTAESISQHVQKPLISLSIGDLIWDESKLQERLAGEFSRAADWDAILLLDEADVVLEARSFEDVRRNGIVSVFLRELEYYKGVLFLTTNRISTMDVAFQSRIQIGIGFKDLTPAVRKEIWLSLLDLNKDASTDLHALNEIKDKLETLAKWELNGREIRNVLNVADAYAYREFKMPGRMSYGHVDKAVRAAVEFKQLLEAERQNLRTEQSVWAPYSGDGL
ncbi:hypothetical protein HD806DRAFT_504100 [Xylariaceae sp. AK1471]|nr:hypothetical protein HD806DRAFT_504100 [Xylariaceae sp. AK1471]